MLATDYLTTVFDTRGASGLFNVFGGMAKAQERMRVAQVQFDKATKSSDVEKKYLALQDAARGVVAANLRVAASYSAMSFSIVAALDNALARYVKFGNEVMNIRGLTGSSTQSSVQAALLARTAGLSDSQELRELLHSGTAMFDSKGQGALARLGIPANANTGGLEIFNQVSNRLGEMQDGLRKTKLMEDLFGARGVAAMLPLLRLTKEQREEVADLASNYDGKALASIQRFQVATSILGQTFEQRFLFPIASHFMPIVDVFTKLFTWMLKIGNALDNITHGSLSWVATMALTGLAILGVVRSVQALIAAFRALAAIEAITTALSGNWLAIAGVTAASAAAIWGIGRAMDSAADDTNSMAAGETNDKFNDAVEKFDSAVTRMGDSITGLKGNGVPSSLGPNDVGWLARYGTLNAVG